jgi:hypothetical protein
MKKQTRFRPVHQFFPNGTFKDPFEYMSIQKVAEPSLSREQLKNLAVRVKGEWSFSEVNIATARREILKANKITGFEKLCAESPFRTH